MTDPLAMLAVGEKGLRTADPRRTAVRAAAAAAAVETQDIARLAMRMAVFFLSSHNVKKPRTSGQPTNEVIPQPREPPNLVAGVELEALILYRLLINQLPPSITHVHAVPCLTACAVRCLTGLLSKPLPWGLMP